MINGYLKTPFLRTDREWGFLFFVVPVKIHIPHTHTLAIEHEISDGLERLLKEVEQ